MPTSSVVEITDAGGGKFTSVSEATLSGVTGCTASTYSVDGKDYAVSTEPAQPG